MEVNCLVIAKQVVHAERGIQDVAGATYAATLSNSSAVTRCLDYLVDHGRRAYDAVELARERSRAVGLLLIIAAMQLGSVENVLEMLRMMGTRNVGTRGMSPAQRFRKAGEARKRPISGERYYVRAGHAAEVQRQFAHELEVVLTDPVRLDLALAQHGDEAIIRYL